MIRTRVGYAGGDKADPTYYSLGGHSETIQIDYDPAQISYEELLDVFWSSHNPAAKPWSRQYASLIFYHDEEQKRLAEETAAREAAAYGGELFTEIVPYTGFYLAEDYHQKYRLQSVPALKQIFHELYPDPQAFVDSTLAARVNGYVGGHGSLEAIRATVDQLDLPPGQAQRLMDIVSDLGR